MTLMMKWQFDPLLILSYSCHSSEMCLDIRYMQLGTRKLSSGFFVQLRLQLSHRNYLRGLKWANSPQKQENLPKDSLNLFLTLQVLPYSSYPVVHSFTRALIHLSQSIPQILSGFFLVLGHSAKCYSRYKKESNMKIIISSAQTPE